MIALAVSILLSTVLYLVDKNQKWSTFWKITRRGLVAVVLLTVAGGSALYLYQRHEAAAKAAMPEFTIEPPPHYSDLPQGAKVVSVPPKK